MTDVDNAIRRWWLHVQPSVKSELFKAYRVGALEDNALRMLHRAMRVAFIAGWDARGEQADAAGNQADLFDPRKHEEP
jgi:hypothetical protein